MQHDQAAEPVAGLYVHIPFCTKRCHYCDFVVKPLQKSQVSRFWISLQHEVERTSSAWSRVRFSSLFLGGGTPSAVPLDDLVRLLGQVRQAYNWQETVEVTVEANPESVDPEWLGRLRDAGVNRLSLGLQAWQDNLLAALGRSHCRRDFIRAFLSARRAGFDNINVDLMYGLPEQTLSDWLETLAAVLELKPEHVSVYGLQVETGTAFARWREEGRLSLPREDQEVAMQMTARRILRQAGYVHYEIANFARPGYSSTHNRNYWLYRPYLGLGPGAHSFRNAIRWWNVGMLRRYHERLSTHQLPIAGEEHLSFRQQMSEYVFLRLRLLERGLSLNDFASRFGRPLDRVYPGAIEHLVRLRWLLCDGDRLRLTGEALPLANRVFSEFV